jgi:ATP-binding cassette subfamily B protein
MEKTIDNSEPQIRAWQYLWKIVRHFPWLYLGLFIFESMFFAVFPQLAGFIMRGIFDHLTNNAAAGTNVYTLIALLVANAAAKGVSIFIDVWIYFNFRWSVAALLRNNVFTQILQRPGARAVPDSPGEAVSRFRGDVDEIAFYLSESLIVTAFGLFTLVSVIVMLRIDPLITLIVTVPLVVVIVISNAATKAIQKYRKASRKAAGKVTGFIGELFGAAQAIKVASAEDHIINHFGQINQERKRATVRDRLFGELLRSVFRNTVNLGTGLVLLMAGEKMTSGNFSVGDFAIFVYYMGFTSDFAALVGEHLAWIKQVGISFQRLFYLVKDDKDTVVKDSPIYLHKELPEVPFIMKHDYHRMEILEAKGLTYFHDDNSRGISGVNLTILRGSFTIVTGRIGSGKTTLLRSVLGLLPMQDGVLFWTPQVPLLFSESLRDNVLMGLPVGEVDLISAIRLAVLDQDLQEFEHGLDTMLGAKGVKLSGGQLQRTAAARMFVRNPELLVFDDISSALDVETEGKLWERVFEEGETTCLAVSHRKPVLRRADQIILLKDGQVEGRGKLAELLDTCEEMQHLWQGDIHEQAAR